MERSQYGSARNLSTQSTYCVIVIPSFDTDGRLPKGIHSATWAELVERFGGSERRRFLLGGLFAPLTHFAEAGCQRVFIGGSFVTAKANPRDVDVLWDEIGVDLDIVHPVFLDLFNGPIATKMLFGAEFFPALLIEGRTRLTFLEFFQQTRGNEPTGIVVIDLDTLERDP